MPKASTKTRFKDFGQTQSVSDFPPLGFALNGEEFTCHPAIAGATLLDFVKRADSDSGGVAADAIVTFLEEALEDQERDRFKALILDPEQIVEVETLGEIAGWLVEQYATRPTKEPSRSSNGHKAAGTGSTDTSSDEE